MSRPFVLVQLSDFHVGADWGRDPVAQLREAVAAVADLPDPPDAIVLSGDLADDGEPASYEAVRKELARLRAPLFPLPGNHDRRGPLREAFGLAGQGEERIDYSAELGPLRLLVLDSIVPGQDSGAFDATALTWLDAELAAAPGLPALLATHHPPLATGIPAWDGINLSAADRQALGEVVARHPQLLAIVGGHLHSAMGAALAGRPVLAAPSVYLPTAPRFGSAEVPHSELGPGGFVVHVLHEGELASHFRRFGS
ncbi:MAG: phosphodiesterase [Actinobacteria bacterium]|nr:phosphodiesterase [Actinomycetota bacterium]